MAVVVWFGRVFLAETNLASFARLFLKVNKLGAGGEGFLGFIYFFVYLFI